MQTERNKNREKQKQERQKITITRSQSGVGQHVQRKPGENFFLFFMRTIGLHWEKGAFDIFIGKIFIWKKMFLSFRLTEEIKTVFYMANLNVNTDKVNVF